MAARKIIVYGGRGALGAECVKYFKTSKWWVANIDINPNDKADFNITVPIDDTLTQQETHVMSLLGTALKGEKVNAILCVAGGWATGNAAQDLTRQAELMWCESVWSSIIAVSVASKHLGTGGMLALTGDKAALEGTPSMIGYGMAKAAVHHLTRSLGAKESGLPKDSLVVAILPAILDTEMNRQLMPNADFSSWTPTTFVTQLFDKWIKGVERPPSGSLVTLVTQKQVTKLLLPSLMESQRKKEKIF